MEEFTITLDSAVKFELIRQALSMAAAIDDGQADFANEISTPILTPSGHPAYMRDRYPEGTAFLICGGPSLLEIDPTKLQQRGILSMGVNNAGSVIRTNLWCCVDPPDRFCCGIWADPGITKFVPMEYLTETLSDSITSSNSTGLRVSDMPSVYGFIRNLDFDVDRWLSEPSINYGQHEEAPCALGHHGRRSVLLVALKLLYVLGVRVVYLVGCDFQMSSGSQNYAFRQQSGDKYIASNNETYRILDSRLTGLRPVFEEHGFHVFNCTPHSGLKAFPFRDFDEAVQNSLIDSQLLHTEGMYSRKFAARNRIPISIAKTEPASTVQ